MGPKKNIVNKPVTKPVRANPAVYPASSSSTSVPTHPYGTRTKTKALEEAYAQTLPTLSQNPLYDTSSPIQGLEEFSVAQHVSYQGINASRQFSFNEHDSNSSSASVPSSPSKTSSGVMNVMTTGTTSLEEQISLLTKTVDTLTATIQEKDKQIAAMMEQILNFTGKRLDTSDENRHAIFQEDGENSNMVGAKDSAAINDTKDSAAKDSQQKLSEAVTASQLKDLIKEAIKDQVDSVIQPSYTYAKPYSQRIDCSRILENY